MKSSKVILITGVSSGLGRAIARAGLYHGHTVVGTFRNETQRLEFEQLSPGRSIGRILDVVDTAAIRPIVDEMEETFGHIDVLINNAGFGLRGFVEELALDDLRRQFEVNVFAPVAMIQAVLPGMRSRKHGHIVNIASMGGIVTFPELSAYHGSKFALLGISDALSKEVAGLGISVTSVLPGVYRSDWSGRSQTHADHTIHEYDTSVAKTPTTTFQWGDPAALGEVVIKAIELDTPPKQLLVGPTAIKMVRERLAEMSEEIDYWQELSFANGEG